MPFAIPNATEVRDPVNLGRYLNGLTDGAFGITILVVLFVILMASIKYSSNTSTEKAFSSAAFITMIISYGFFLIEWVPATVLPVTTVVTVVGAAIVYYGSNKP